MSTMAMNRQIIQRMLAALPRGREKFAEESGSMEDPGFQHGTSSAPSAQPQEGTCPAEEGARGEEYSQDLRDISPRWLPDVSKPEPKKTDNTELPTMGDAAQHSPVGEDPSSEEDSARKTMQDPGYQGGETSSPTRYEEKAAARARIQQLRKQGAALLMQLAAEVGPLPVSQKSGSVQNLNDWAVKAGEAAADAAIAMTADEETQNAIATDTIQRLLLDAELGAVKTAAYLYGLQTVMQWQNAVRQKAAEEAATESADSEETENSEEKSDSSNESSEAEESASTESSNSEQLSPEEEALLALLMSGASSSNGTPGSSGSDEDLRSFQSEPPPEAVLNEVLSPTPDETDSAVLDSVLASGGIPPEDLQQALTGKMTSAAARLASGSGGPREARVLNVMTKLATALPIVLERRRQRAPAWRPKTARDQQIQRAMLQFVRELVHRS